MIAKFKVGDRVKVIRTPTSKACNACHGNCDFLNKIRTICSLGEDMIGVTNFDRTAYWCSGFDEESLELVENIKRIIKEFPIVAFMKRSI